MSFRVFCEELRQSGDWPWVADARAVRKAHDFVDEAEVRRRSAAEFVKSFLQKGREAAAAISGRRKENAVWAATTQTALKSLRQDQA
jgi:hypothetical protein